MKEEFNAALTEALDKIGRHTTPEQLTERGVRRVLSVTRQDVSRLIEVAVNRTLMERTIGGLSESEKGFVIDEAKERFHEGLKNMEALRESRADAQSRRDEMERGLAKLRRQLAPRRGFVEQFEQEQAAEVDAEALKQLRLRTQARLLPIFDRLPPGSPTLRATVAELMELFTAERDRALGVQRDGLADEIDHLERRITKLLKSLEDTEKVLERISAAKDLEVGIESIYRSVQGLGQNDANMERKREMMSVIFQANLELQGDMIQSAAKPAVAATPQTAE